MSKKKLSPDMFYFRDVTDENSDEDMFPGMSFFAIVYKKFFDKHKHWDDRSCWFEEVLPEGFGEVMESLFETEIPREEAKQQLLNAGFIENEQL